MRHDPRLLPLVGECFGGFVQAISISLSERCILDADLGSSSSLCEGTHDGSLAD
jgi:hypothetical protein